MWPSGDIHSDSNASTGCDDAGRDTDPYRDQSGNDAYCGPDADCCQAHADNGAYAHAYAQRG